MPGRTLSSCVVAIVLCAVSLRAQAPASRIRTPSVLPINSVVITGNKDLKTEAILTVLGLKSGENGGPAAFDAARDRLLDTGYFDVVSYSYRQQDLGFAVTFNVTEFKQVYPLAVEALPITLDQVKQLLKAKNPLFNGLLPGTKPVIDRAAAAIQQSVVAANPELTVRAKVIAIGPDRYEIQFAPSQGLPVIADATFEGSAVIKDSELHEVMVEHGIGQVFSETDVRLLLDRSIRPLFEKQGYIRVSFPTITSKPSTTVKGLDLHITVVDGPRFRLGNVTVRGQLAGDKRILRMANLPPGDFADGEALQQGANRILETLRGEGYLDVQVSTERSIDDTAKIVNLWFDVDRGELYSFGRLEILGLGLDGEAAIRKMWAVKSGDPFPGGYPDHFVAGVKSEGLFDNLGGITAAPSINRQTHVVDVTLRFASAPPAQPGRRVQ